MRGPLPAGQVAYALLDFFFAELRPAGVGGARVRPASEGGSSMSELVRGATALSVAALLLCRAAPVRADFVATDTEPNNTFATIQSLPAGNGRVTGTITPGDVDNFQFHLTPGATYAAAI